MENFFENTAHLFIINRQLSELTFCFESESNRPSANSPQPQRQIWKAIGETTKCNGGKKLKRTPKALYMVEEDILKSSCGAD